MVDETTAYKQWLTWGRTDRAIIATVQVIHNNVLLGSWANWDRDISCTLEADPPGNSNQVTFLASRFLLAPNTVEDSLEQNTALVVSSYEGVLYDTFIGIPLYDGTPEDRTSPITILTRLYFHDDFSQPLMSKPTTWTIHSVTATFDAVNVNLSTRPLRDHKAGIYYTSREFPSLRYL